jgi:hypothetical protein
MKDNVPSRGKACSLLDDATKKQDGCHYKNGWLHVGNVGVDSGTIIVTDGFGVTKKYIDMLYKASLGKHFNSQGADVIVSSFGGDGVFPVFVKLKGKGYPMVDKMLVNFNYRSENMFDFLEKKNDK